VSVKWSRRIGSTKEVKENKKVLYLENKENKKVLYFVVFAIVTSY